MSFTRRQFMAGSLGTLGVLATGGRPRPFTRFEGIYTDKFCYRTNESVVVHAALATRQTVDIHLMRLDLPATTIVATYEAEIPTAGNDKNAGVLGAWFQQVLQIPLSGLSPGCYQVAIAPEILQPANRENTANGFVSYNHLARFVVTAAQPGTHSRLLWLHDSLTGVSYGSFGGQSIYGPPGVRVRTVSYARPGLDRAGLVGQSTLRRLRQSGFEFEYMDLLRLTQVPVTFLDAYDLIVCAGTFEYVPHAAMVNLAGYLQRGGNLFVASAEFALFRIRLDTLSKQQTTYRDFYETEDPFYGTGSPHVAGVGMNISASLVETEVIAQTLWAGHHIDPSTASGSAELELHNGSEAGWILDGTGLGDGDVLPERLQVWGTGNLIDFDDAGRPFVVEQQRTRTPAGTIVWATAPTLGARQWWHLGPTPTWPIVPGHATATYQQRPSGAQVVTFPHTPTWIHPVSTRILTNVVSRLSTRA